MQKYLFFLLLLSSIFTFSTLLNAAGITPAIATDSFDIANSSANFDGVVKNKPTLAMLNASFGLENSAPSWTMAEIQGKTRHFVVAFKSAIDIGTIITHNYPGTDKMPLLALSGTFVSVLKPDAPFPGDPYNDQQWLLLPTGSVKYLPPATKVRALRFSNVSKTVDWRANTFNFG